MGLRDWRTRFADRIIRMEMFHAMKWLDSVSVGRLISYVIEKAFGILLIIVDYSW